MTKSFNFDIQYQIIYEGYNLKNNIKLKVIEFEIIVQKLKRCAIM